ncbi:toll/interleukin-1 receptor domain-containing protein [Luteibacter sp. PPL201]|uniref:Toll/interleukin-1 receptor domain-containing protein n=1 Tax=Luteibacter sahnii TaxID=3021977 RepID=A0ABT6BC83_9GAMM
MAEYFTLREAREAAQRAKAAGVRSSAELLNEGVSAATHHQFDVFLSHSMKDADIVLGIKLLLEAQGLKVYVDWIVDKQLDRSKVSATTAETLRKRMGQCKSLIYIASANAPQSKWMPWELGYFDGKKGDEQVAILPLVNYQGEQFPGQEYLGLYAVVQKDVYKSGLPDVFVEVPGKHWKTLRRFGDSGGWSLYG